MGEELKSWFPFHGRFGRRQYWISTILYLFGWLLGTAEPTEGRAADAPSVGGPLPSRKTPPGRDSSFPSFHVGKLTAQRRDVALGEPLRIGVHQWMEHDASRSL